MWLLVSLCRSRNPLVRPDSLSIGSSWEADDFSMSSSSLGNRSRQQRDQQRDQQRIGQHQKEEPVPLMAKRQQSDGDSSTSSDNDTNNKWQNLPKEAWKQAAEVKQYY